MALSPFLPLGKIEKAYLESIFISGRKLIIFGRNKSA
jgi:hypothetical protein